MVGNKLPLGNLQRIPNIRLVWPHEARNFSKWLSESENLDILATTLGFETGAFELEGVEVPVGPYSADIVCRDGTSPDQPVVVIENQFGKFNHDHLGKTLTYGASLGAKTIIIVAEEFGDEHRSALEWLNSISEQDFRFFGVVVELWKIGDSLPAPKFEIVVKPDNWERQLRANNAIRADQGLNPGQEEHLAYWSAFREFTESNLNSFRLTRKPPTSPYYGMSINRANFELNVERDTWNSAIRVALTLYGKEAKRALGLLELEREAIESELGYSISWDLSEARTQQYLRIIKPDTDPSDQSDWPNQFRWLSERLSEFNKVLTPRVNRLDLEKQVIDGEIQNG